jgi:hypothetical protein
MSQRIGPAVGRPAAVVLMLLVAASAIACSSTPAEFDDGAGLDTLRRGTDPAGWDVRPGVEQITVTGAEPGEPLTLYGTSGEGGRKLLTLRADEHGQAHFAYLPAEHVEVQSGADLDYAALGDMSEGGVVEPGRYPIRDDSASPELATDVITVPGREDAPDTALYGRQQLTGVELDIVGGVKAGASLDDGFQYIEMRDGVKLSTMVRLPDSALYGDGPYPTVIEYSGPASRGCCTVRPGWWACPTRASPSSTPPLPGRRASLRSRRSRSSPTPGSRPGPAASSTRASRTSGSRSATPRRPREAATG